jgi:signal transduction histidine kinase
MRRQIKHEILIPFAVVQTAAILLLSVSAAWLAVKRAERETLDRLAAVVRTLDEASFPLHSSTLESMKGLSQAEFVTADSSGTVLSSTLPVEVADRILDAMPGNLAAPTDSLDAFLPVRDGNQSWRAGQVRIRRSPGTETLFVIIPERSWRNLQRETIWPPLLIGVVAIVTMISVSYVLAERLARPLRKMQQQVQQIAGGHFAAEIPESTNQEMHDLAASIQQMAAGLKAMTEQIRTSERTSLVTQVAGGLAHQLRNAISGASMAVQLHLRRCRNNDSESLRVALHQLSSMESQIRGLLRLTHDVQRVVIPGEIGTIVSQVRSLVTPECEHQGIRLVVMDSTRDCVVRDSEQTEAAVLNLVRNAIEAAGPGGEVEVRCSETVSDDSSHCIVIEVLDNGDGVAVEMESRIFDPFVTTKREGVGLGLTQVARAARDHSGTVGYDRIDSRTRFRLILRVRLTLRAESVAAEVYES